MKSLTFAENAHWNGKPSVYSERIKLKTALQVKQGILNLLALLETSDNQQTTVAALLSEAGDEIDLLMAPWRSNFNKPKAAVVVPPRPAL